MTEETMTEEKELLSIWIEAEPLYAFQYGIDDGKDKLFIPTKENIASLLKKINNLYAKTKDEDIKVHLKSFKAMMTFEEPQVIFSELNYGLFTYSLKKTKTDILLLNFSKVLSIFLNEKKIYPIGVRLLSTILIEELKKEISDEVVIKQLDLLKEKYGNLKTDYKSQYEIFSRKDAFGKKRKHYREMLRDYFVMYEPIPKLYELSVTEYKKNLKKYFVLVEELKKKYGAKDLTELQSKLTVLETDTVGYMKKIRPIVEKAVNNYIVDIPKEHNTKIIETPPSLRNVIPGAAIMEMDTFSKRGIKSCFFITPNKKGKGRESLIFLLVHEEFGHGLNFTLSGTKFKRKVFDGTGYTISDSIAVNTEYQFLDLIDSIPEIDEKTKDAYKLTVGKRLLMIHLRSMGDIILNTGKSLTDFTKKRSQETGIDEEELFNEVIATQYSHPGYRTVYSVSGTKLQNIIENSKLPLKEINKRIYSFGYSSRKIFEREIKKLG